MSERTQEPEDSGSLAAAEPAPLRSIYTLARLADCGDPDTPESDGATFLRSVESSVAEAIEYGADADTAHEIADGCVPVYTHGVWSTFVDLQAYQEDATELGDDGSDLTKSAQIALYMIGERLATALLLEHEADNDNEEDDDE